MKRCPQCSRDYTDNTLNFCLEDGASLSIVRDPDATLVDRIYFDSKGKPAETLKPEIIASNEHPKIEIIEGQITIDGARLRIPTTLDEVEYVLGEPSRRITSILTLNAHIWDDLGVYCNESKEEFKVFLFGVFLNRRFTEGETKKTFKGLLYIDNVRIDNKSTISAINGHKTGELFTNEIPKTNAWSIYNGNIRIALIASSQEVVYAVSVLDLDFVKTEKPPIKEGLSLRYFIRFRLTRSIHCRSLVRHFCRHDIFHCFVVND